MATVKNPKKSHLSPQERKKFTPKKFLKSGSAVDPIGLREQTIGTLAEVNKSLTSTLEGTYINWSWLTAADKLQRDLTDRLGYWQKVLRLQDWNLTIRIVNNGDLDAHGAVDGNVKFKQGVIKIADPATVDPKSGDRCPLDPEVTLVHELVHLHFCPFEHLIDQEKNKQEHLYEELAIELVAQALVNLDRKTGSMAAM